MRIESSYEMERKSCVIGEDNGGNPDTLQCPKCADHMVHLEKPIHHSEEEYSSPIGNRNDWIEIPAWCECGIRMNLILGQHKGVTQVQWVIMPKRQLSWTQDPWKYTE